MTRLTLEQLVLDIPNGRQRQPLSLSMEAGQSWGILGPNGVGKTTLLHTLASLKASYSGAVMLNQAKLLNIHRLSLAQQIGIMFQEHQDGFPATVFETALMGRFPHLSPWEMESEQDLALARAALERLDLTGLAERSINNLSGGERQRTALASLVTQNPDVWLVDEPTNHLDLHHQVSTMALLAEQAQHHKLVIMSLHDVNLAAQWCSHVLLMYQDGNACFGRAEELLTKANLEPLYQQKLAEMTLEGKALFFPLS